MSELQLGLVGIGAAVVVGVFFYNKWQELRYRREAEGSFESRHEDVLMQAERGAEGGNAAGRAERVEPVLEFPAPGPHEDAISAPGLSEELDFLVEVESPEQIAGEAAIEAIARVFAGRSDRVHWEGFDEAASSWAALDADRSYPVLRAGLQLADRRGAANAEELAEFGAMVEDVAEALGASAAVPDTVHALARAADLDRFCSDVDIRIAVHVLTEGSPVSGGALLALAEATGFVLDDDGLFHRRDAAGRTGCTLGNYEGAAFDGRNVERIATRGITLELDVPRSVPGAFDAFREVAEHAARELDGRIVDDNLRPLGPEEFGAIEAQIQSVFRSMEARGLKPGGALALRLFS
jgi:ZipA, C-terminal FtsZ-binding domain